MAVTALRGPDVSSMSRGFLDFMVSMQSLKERKRIAGTEEASRQRYHKLLGRQIGLAEEKFDFEKRRHEETKELKRELDVAKTRSAELEVEEAQLKLDAINAMSVDEYKTYITTDMVFKQMRAQSQAQQAEINSLKTGLSIMDMQRKLQADIEGKVNRGTTRIGSIDLPPGMIIPFQQELGSILRRKYTTKDPEILKDIAKQESALYKEMRTSIAKEQDRILKAEVGKEERAAKTKAKGVREAVELKKDIPKVSYEFGSLMEVQTARVNLQTTPEVRSVYYDKFGMDIPFIGWEAKDSTGLRVPHPYQSAGYKLMTEKRAIQLDLHTEWVAAGANAELPENVDLGKTTIEELMKEK